MKFFLDTANIDEIKELIPTGFVDGITTNPSLIAKQGGKMEKIIEEICNLVKGPVSAEVTATDFETMLKEGKYLASIAKNIAVKVPLTENGLKTCVALREKNIPIGNKIIKYGNNILVRVDITLNKPLTKNVSINFKIPFS